MAEGGGVRHGAHCTAIHTTCLSAPTPPYLTYSACSMPAPTPYTHHLIPP